jgi:hypothetical protein
MDAPLTNDYHARAREILGDRTDTEIEYDNTVVAFLAKGINIKSAVDAANREHPDEALNPNRPVNFLETHPRQLGQGQHRQHVSLVRLRLCTLLLLLVTNRQITPGLPLLLIINPDFSFGKRKQAWHYCSTRE